MNAPLKKLGDWLSHPINLLIGFVGALASILGIYFYFQSIEKRELNFYVHPVKATVVKTGQASKLTVSVAGNVVTNDITAVQIAFWNAGKRPIKKGEILEPIVISCGAGHPILEVSLKKVTRPLTHVVLETTNLENGEVGVSWDILEQSDGGILQVVYSGEPSTPFGVRGTVEGQGAAPPRVSAEILDQPAERFAPGNTRIFGWVTVGVTGLAVSLHGVLAFLERRRKGLARLLNVFPLCLFCGLFLYCLWRLFHTPKGPPFSF
jgi:hypothetical protein